MISLKRKESQNSLSAFVSLNLVQSQLSIYMREQYMQHHPEPSVSRGEKFLGVPSGAWKEVGRDTEPMPEAQLGDMLAAVGNHEAKALLFAMMADDGTAQSGLDLRRQFMTSQGERPVWRISHSSPGNYMRHSFLQAGLISPHESAEESVGEVYGKTEQGRELGNALVGHLLHFSERYGISLQNVFGQTNSTGQEKPPIVNYSLYKELLSRDEPASASELVEILGRKLPADKLALLAQDGMITYKAREAGRAFIHYAVREDRPEEDPPIFNRQRGWTARVSAIALEESGELNSDTLIDKYLEKYPNTEVTKAEVRRRISGVLGHLAKTGYLHRKESFSGNKQTQISLNPDKRAMAGDLIQIIEQFRMQDPVFLGEGKRLAQEIVADPERVCSLLLKFRETSKTIDSSKIKVEASRKIAEIIEGSSTGISAEQIHGILAEEGSTLTTRAVREIVKTLRQSGAIALVREGRPAFYGAVTDTESQQDNEYAEKPAISVFEASEGDDGPEIIDSGERISEGKLGDLLAAFGNHEAKALVLLLMGKEGEVHGRTDLYKLFAGAQQGHVGWQDIGETIPIGYCKHSLAPIGLVAQEEIIGDFSELGYDSRRIGYAKTEEGARLGDALAGHLLAFSERHPEFSLQDFFGSTSSPSNAETIAVQEPDGSATFHRRRAPYISYKLFWELLTRNTKISNQEAQDSLGYSLNADRLLELKTQGVIEYESNGVPSATKVYFQINKDRPDEPPPIYREFRGLTTRIAELALQGRAEEFDSKAILERYMDTYPTDRDPASIRSDISTVLSHLVRTGYLTRGEGIRGEVRTQIFLQPEQREVLEDLVGVLDRFQSGDPEFMKEGRRLASEITSDPERTAALAAKIKAKSNTANAIERAASMEKIKQIVAQNPDISATEVQVILTEQGGKLGRGAVRNLVRVLRTKEEIVVTEDGTPPLYGPAESNVEGLSTDINEEEPNVSAEPQVGGSVNQSIGDSEVEIGIYRTEASNKKGKIK